MIKKILPAAIAAICAISVVPVEADSENRSSRGQTIGGLPCEANQVAEFDGARWMCIDTPSGSGTGAPEYEFVDDDGNILGDVVYLEDRMHAFGYFDYLSTTSIIEVTALSSKQGEPVTDSSFAGNFIYQQPNYLDSECANTAYSGTPTRQFGMLEFLESDVFYFWPSSDGTLWRELVPTNVPAPGGNQDWYFRQFSDSACVFSSNSDKSYLVEVSIGDEVALPPTPIWIVKKP
jgi:hypothetical protein